MSISSSDGLSGSLSKSSCLKIIWQVEQERVPSQAPKSTTNTGFSQKLGIEALVFIIHKISKIDKQN